MTATTSSFRLLGRPYGGFLSKSSACEQRYLSSDCFHRRGRFGKAGIRQAKHVPSDFRLRSSSSFLCAFHLNTPVPEPGRHPCSEAFLSITDTHHVDLRRGTKATEEASFEFDRDGPVDSPSERRWSSCTSLQVKSLSAGERDACGPVGLILGVGFWFLAIVQSFSRGGCQSHSRTT